MGRVDIVLGMMAGIVSQKFYVEVPTPGTLEYDLIWKKVITEVLVKLR